MVGCFLLGTFTSRYIENAGDFFIAGKALPFWAIGFSIVVSDIGALDFVGVAGNAYRYGVSAANFDWLGSMPAMVFAAFIFVPYFWRSGVFTIPEFLGRRYNSAVQIINAVIWVSFMLLTLLIMLWTTADDLVYTVLGYKPIYTVGVMAGVPGFYTFAGGLSAVVMTDVVQLVVMYVGGLGLLTLSLWEVGGWGAMRTKIEAMGPEFANHFNILLPNSVDNPFPWTGIVFGLGIVLAIAYMSGNQVIVHRTLGARSEWDAKAGMLTGGFLKSFIPLMVALPGLCAIVYLHEKNIILHEQDKVIPTMIRMMLPPGLRGLMFAALFAALMSSISGTLSSASTIFVTDIFNKLWMVGGRKSLDERQALYVGRVLPCSLSYQVPYLQNRFRVSGEFTILFKPYYHYFKVLIGHLTARDYMETSHTLGWISRIIVRRGFLFYSWCVPNLFPAEDPFLFVSMWSFVFSIVVTVIVSLLTPPEPEEKIRGLVWGSVVRDTKAQDALAERVQS
jgi:SSS family solute:Na+ symporter